MSNDDYPIPEIYDDDEIAKLRDDLGEALVRENNLLALLGAARSYVEYCAEGSNGAAAVLREIDALNDESKPPLPPQP